MSVKSTPSPLAAPRRPWRFAAALLPLLAALAAGGSEVSPEPRALAALKAQAMLGRVSVIDAARVGERDIAVGERGAVFVSVDGAGTWTPKVAPTEKTLTSVVPAPGGVLLATGHSGTILRSADGGETWQPAATPGPRREALMGVLPLDAERALAYGGYGTFLASADGGQSWERAEILGPDVDKHIYGVARDGNTLVLVGETGLIAVSDDQGKAWQTVPSPYAGSLFGVAALHDHQFIAFGMRGKILRSVDGGRRWSELPAATNSPLFAATRLRDGSLVIGGKDGVLVRVAPGGEWAETRHTPDRRSVARVIEGRGGEWLLFGDGGVRSVRWESLATK